jgi:hypothetical protein
VSNLLANNDIYGEFARFGYCDITATYTHYAIVPIEVEIRIILDPKLSPEETSDANVRNAMYGLAEAAIKYARENYILTEAPYLVISGQSYHKRFIGQPGIDPVIVTEGKLTLNITDKDLDRCR